MISPIANNFTQNRTNSISFTAIPLAKYGYMQNDKDVTIYQLEKSDIGYIKHLINNLDLFYKKYDVDNESARQVIDEALRASIEILNSSYEKKARILMAFYDDKPSSILIGNVLKVDKKGNFHYSSRKNHSKNETELDWLATWNKEIPREGEATVYEYFFTLLKDGFKQCFVRSEVPSKSSAKKFYIKMGFEQLSKNERPLFRKNDNRYVIGNYDDKTDMIIPMKATVMDIIKSINEKTYTIMRRPINKKVSVTLPKENFDITAA